MSQLAKLVEKLVSGTADANFSFDDLRYVLKRMGFTERIRGSHHVYRSADLPSVKLVLQPDGHEAKPYQVAQVRKALLEQRSGGETDGSL